MLTNQDLLRGIVLPVAVALVIALVGAWRRWEWAMPIAGGAGFLIAYHAIARAAGSVPQWTPRDGADWLYWLAMPLTVIAALDAHFRPRFGWVLGGLAGVVALVLIRPISASVPANQMWVAVFGLGAAGVALAWVGEFAARRYGAVWPLLAFTVVLGGAGVVVLASNYKSFGQYGLAAAAALGPVAVLSFRTPGGARGVALLAATLLAGVLAAAHFYVDPGVTRMNMAVLLAAPLLLLVAIPLPVRKPWVRGVIGVAATAIAVVAVAAPAALAAKRAAENPDPYGYYGSQ